jgi:hypothetical protein
MRSAISDALLTDTTVRRDVVKAGGVVSY